MLRLKYVQLPDGRIRDIVIEDGKIVRIEQCSRREKKEGPHRVFPGLIDPHVHDRTPGAEHKETVEHMTDAAIHGGVTTVFTMPNTNPTITTIEELEKKEQLIINSPINHFQWFGVTPTNLHLFPRVVRYRIVPGFKSCTTHTTGTDQNFIITETEDIRRAYQTVAGLNAIMASHTESDECIKQNLKNLGREPQISDHCLIRSTEAEVRDIMRVLAIQEEIGCLLYICHVSTPEGLELTYAAKKRGARVYTEVCPHHWKLPDFLLNGEDGGFYKVNPPLRSWKKIQRMAELLCIPGYVDCVASDHAPHTFEEKRRQEYDKVPSGVPGVQTIFPLVFSLVLQGKMTMEHFINLTSRNAAKIFRLGKKGVIEEGADADLIVVDPDAQHIILNEDMKSKCGWTPYHGMVVQGKVMMTIARGKLVYQAN